MMSEEIEKEISRINRELDDLSATISGFNSEIDVLKGKSEDLAKKRQELQKLMEAGERAKDIQEAEKQLTDLERQANSEMRKIYEAHLVVVGAARNLEALNVKARGITKRFPEVRFVHFDVLTDAIRKFSYPQAVPTSWSNL